MKTKAPSQAGFSLIELMVAMVITMIISGAIYGLLSGGQNAFRREPELTDRQQNIRVGMDMIQRDLGSTGMGMGAFFQTFTNNLNSAGVMGPNGPTDILELFGNSGECPDSPAQPNNPTNGANINALAPIPPCYSNDAFVLVIYEPGDKAKWGMAHNIHAANMMVNFPPGVQPSRSQINSVEELGQFDPYSAPPDTSPPMKIAVLQMVRWEVAPDADGIPGLWRSQLGGRDLAVGNGTYTPAPDPLGGWQLIARGVEDLQVQYRNGNGAWADIPGVVTCDPNCAAPTPADYNTLIRECRVTLTARVISAGLAGETKPTGGATQRLRGQLTSTSSPRSALFYLGKSCEPNCNAGNPPLWQ